MLILLAILLQLLCCYLSYKIYNLKRQPIAWILFSVAFILMALRRGTSFLVKYGTYKKFALVPLLDSTFLPGIITILFFVGLLITYISFSKKEKIVEAIKVEKEEILPYFNKVKDLSTELKSEIKKDEVIPLIESS